MRRVTLVVVTLVIYLITTNGLTYAGEQGIIGKLFALLGIKLVNTEETSQNSDTTLKYNINGGVGTMTIDPFPRPPVLPDTTK